MIRSSLLRAQLGAGADLSPEVLVAQFAGNPEAWSRFILAVDATYARLAQQQQMVAELERLVVLEWDLQSGRIDAGRAWKQLLGYGPDDLPDTLAAWRGQLENADWPLLQQDITRHQRGELNAFSRPCRFQSRDGTWHWYAVSGRIVSRDSRGEPLRFVVVMRDVDTERRLEASLQHSKEEAEAATRARSAFLANMSHEIRTPMNAILGMTELALDTALDAEQRHYLATVRSSAESLLSIINDILDFSKIEAGKLQVERVDFDPGLLICEAVRSLAHVAQCKGLEVLVDCVPGLPARTWGDPLRIRQVLVNLLGNAIKFTESGDVLVRARLAQRRGTEMLLQVDVRDTGIGIARDKQQLIFDAFSQADVSTTRRFGGTGLGLAICAKLISLMGGRIWVDSQEGAGSEFHFTLRLGVAQEPVALVPPPVFTHRRVLLLEPYPAAADLLRTQLEQLGLEVSVVASYGQGMALATTQPVDFMVVDCSRGEGSLSEFLDHWSALNPRPPLVALVTVTGQRELLPQLKGRGVLAHVVKPVVVDDLADALRLVLQPAREAGGEGGRPAALDLAPFDLAGLDGTERGAGLNVLLVEDNPVNQELALRLLEKAGHQVTVANNGVEALECFEGGQFDVIFMDVQMPVMGGLEATRAIRARELRRSWVTSMEEFRSIPIIAMTANAMTGDREKCLQAGMTDYLAKPIRQGELHAALERVMGGRAGVGGSAAPKPAQGKGIRTEEVNLEAAVADLDDPDLVREMARMFLLEWDKHLAAIQQGAARQDGELLRRAAHTFKGLVAMFHADRARQSALRLENAARDGHWAEVEQLVADVLTSAAQVKPVLEAFIAQG